MYGCPIPQSRPRLPAPFRASIIACPYEDLGRYRIPPLGQVPAPLPAGAAGTKVPVCILPFTLNEYHAWFSAPFLQPNTTALPVSFVNAAWMASEV